ncbi:tripartite motif-containing protein 16-like isoform X2 [Conger conger]|uniref:tripartite motif-containing protein 16-like isoform X2 n=1 Tax=Conger conger TaxID=82655 RepID=UPI002A5A14D4|nr:tripartite motif-containing protein 16-like isoform X2 [Conger conger]
MNERRNYRLANIAEDYRQRGRPRPVPAPSPAPVPCDLCCPGDAAGAVKTCLQCEVSMCAEHLRPHLERPAFRTHPLAQPLGDARQRKCPAHDELYRYYCPQDRALLCQACTIEGQHAGHGLQTLKNTMRDLKEALQVQGQRLNRRISRSEKFLQLRADAERDSQRFVEGAEQQVQVVGGQVQGQLGLFLSALRECVRAHSGAGPGAELQRCGGRMAEDRAQLQQAQSSLQALLQQNDPFLFVQEYHSTGKMLRRALKRPLSSPGSVCLDREALVEAMEAKLEEFQTEFRLQISDLIHTVGLETDGEEEEEGREEEVEEEEEDESESDEDEDGDEEDEIRSEGDEEDDHSESADDLYHPEEEEEEEDVSSD